MRSSFQDLAPWSDSGSSAFQILNSEWWRSGNRQNHSTQEHHHKHCREEIERGSSWEMNTSQSKATMNTCASKLHPKSFKREAFEWMEINTSVFVPKTRKRVQRPWWSSWKTQGHEWSTLSKMPAVPLISNNAFYMLQALNCWVYAIFCTLGYQLHLPTPFLHHERCCFCTVR